jgi:hypothetical protein
LKNIGFDIYFKKVKTKVSVAKHLPKRASKPPKALSFGSLNVKVGAILATESVEKSVFIVLSQHFQIKITSLIFPTGVIYWEN